MLKARLPRIMCSAMLMAFFAFLALPAMSDTTLSAIDAAFKSAGNSYVSSDGRDTITAWDLRSNGFIGTFIKLENAGKVTITISAEGQGALGVLPVMHLHTADSKSSWTVADHGSPHNNFDNYTATFTLPAGTHFVRVENTNSYDVHPIRRTIYVKSITFSGADVTVLNEASDANVLAASDDYIRNYRRGPAVITVHNADGTPVAAGTSVRVKMRRLGFMLGTCTGGLSATSDLSTDPYQQFLLKHFNTLVLEAGGKWLFNEATRDTQTMQEVDGMLDFAEINNLRTRMTTVFWYEPGSMPGWAVDLHNRAYSDPAEKEAMREEINERIQYYLKDRMPRFDDVDGINESYHKPQYSNLFGISGVADIYNQMSAACDGKAKMFVNEYNVLNSQNCGYSTWYKTHIQSIIDAGGRVDGIGCQAHIWAESVFSPVTAFQILQDLAGFERSLEITEFSSLHDQAVISNELNQLMRITFGNDMAVGFLVWGFRQPVWNATSEMVDNVTYKQLTPAGVSYEALQAKWNTDETLATNAAGQVRLTGYYGDYDVTVNGKSYPVTIKKGTTKYDVVKDLPIVTDKFSRRTSDILGSTEDPWHHAWAKGGEETAASIDGLRMYLANANVTGGVGMDGFMPADVDMKVDISLGGGAWGGVGYRRSSVGSDKGTGYTLQFSEDGSTVTLLCNGSKIKSASCGPAIDWSKFHNVRVKAVGSSHKVWVDGKNMLECNNSGKLAGGYVNLIRSNGWARFDNLYIVGKTTKVKTSARK